MHHPSALLLYITVNTPLYFINHSFSLMSFKKYFYVSRLAKHSIGEVINLVISCPIPGSSWLSFKVSSNKMLRC